MRQLKTAFTKAGKPDFNLFSQQDVPEILEVILEELSTDSVFLGHLFQLSLQVSVTCNTCLETQVNEESMQILQLPLMSSVQKGLDCYLQSEDLYGENSYFCHNCNRSQPALLERQFRTCGQYLIIQLKRFSANNGSITKNNLLVNCHPDPLFVPIVSDIEVAFKKEFQLKAVINHSGTLNNGHYTSLAKVNSNWFLYNDRTVSEADDSDLNSSMSYVFIFEKH